LIVLAALALFIVYVLFLYPLLLYFWTPWRRQPVVKEFAPRSVSVLLAVRNGERYLAGKLSSLQQLDYPASLLEIFVLSDGSTDQSESIARSFAATDPRIQFFALPARGKWNALNHGLAHASGEILFFTDVRQSLAPDSLRQLVANYADPRVGCASGELMIPGGSGGLYWRYEKFLRKRQSALDSVIGATGAIYTQRRHLCRPLPPDTILDDVHFPLQAFFAGYRVVFDDTAHAWDSPTGLRREFHRKVRTLAGNYQLIAAFPALLSPANRMLFHFLSHKFARLILPFALLAFFSLSVYQQLWTLAAAQVLFYLLPGPCRTFSTLMLATASAASYLWRPAKDFWK
jgi:cellulose synthase/poly-beta-1,6-N-acetylglucosamine synthase-like glycosyltransferase